LHLELLLCRLIPDFLRDHQPLTGDTWGKSMAEKLDKKEIATFEELLMVNLIQVDTITQLLVEKGIFTHEEFFTKLKKVQHEWESKKGAKI
jgi:hypothetical protein